jgi:hypothetical protein
VQVAPYYPRQVPHLSPLRLLVLHGLRLKGFAEAVVVSTLWGLDEAEVAAELKGLAADGLVRRREGRISGWTLTPEGRAEDAALLAAEVDAAGVRPVITSAYRHFLDRNPELLEVCTAWQLKSSDEGQLVNDHTDAAYDRAVIGRLARVHERVQPVLAELRGALGRFERYPARLAHAEERVRAGETAWFTKPLIDSYHTVWFELHEDLLATLGLQRGAEGRDVGSV